MPIDLRIDGESFDLSANYDTTSTLWSSREFVTGEVKAQRRNSNASLSAAFRAAGLSMMDQRTAKTCLYEGVGDNCYYVKVKPTITEVSSTTGYAKGGQVVTFKGTSLDGDTVSVEMDGVECKVLSKSETEVTCKTGEKDTSSSGTPPPAFIGMQGLTRYNFERWSWSPDHDTWRTRLSTASFISQEPWTAFDLSQRLGNYNTFTAFEGYLKAPASGQMRFLMSCDDQCAFKMSITDPLDPAAAETLMYRNTWTTYRNTDMASKTNPLGDGMRYSKWVTVTEGQHYYVEATLNQGGGFINIDIGMEIQPLVMPS